MERDRVAFVIPAYNESATIAGVVESVIEYGVPIVVNDCSSDETGALALESGAVVINHKSNKGYDGALNSGFAKASEMSYEYIVTFDADGQHDAEIVVDVLGGLDEGYDVVVGVRPFKARIAEIVFALFTRIRYGIRDPLCGFKAYSTEYYKRLRLVTEKEDWESWIIFMLDMIENTANNGINRFKDISELIYAAFSIPLL